MLYGVVTDENSAVVAGAAVSIKNPGNKFQQDTTTAGDGSFSFNDLVPGTYVVTVQSKGFSTAEVLNVTVSPNEIAPLKVKLRVGNVDETVTITAEPSVVKQSAGLGISLDRSIIEDLPLSGRSLQNAILLAPGTVATRATFAEQGQISVNGQRANANYFMVDGVSANIGVAAGATGTGQSGAGSLPGLSVMGSTNTLVSLDALQELRVLTSPFAPEYGRTPGGQILMTTRAGTSQFHGSVFEYFRSSAFTARDWFAKPSPTELTASQTHNFGGVFGGPIYKDRTFFFLSFEGLSARVPQYTVTEVPSLAARQLAFPVMQPFLNSFPVPNGPISRNPALAEFASSYTDTARFGAGSVRIDQKLGDKTTIFGRYNYAPSEIVQRGAVSSLNNPMRLSFETQTATLGATTVLTPNLINDFRANYSRSNAEKFFELDNFGGAVPLADSRVFPSYAMRENSFYALSIGGGNTAIFMGKDAASFQDQLNFVETLSYTFGTHQVKVGFDYRQLNSVYDEWKYRENAHFNADLLDLQYGYASAVALSVQDRTTVKFTNISAFAQDTWRVRRRLSLTYGLRWDYNPAPSGDSAQSLFTVQPLDNPTNLDLAPSGTSLYNTTFNNFAPRIGFAYQLSDKRGWESVVRGGYGVFYDLGTGPLGNSASSFPYQRRRVYTNYTYPLDGILNTPLPYTTDLPVSLIRVAEPDLKLPRVMQWNFGIEQSIGSNNVVSASYVRASGRRLLRTEMLLDPNPNFGQVYVTTNNATSDHNALQVQFQSRFTKGFRLIGGYTYAHSNDIASNDSSVNLPALSGYDALRDLGPSDFDVRHSFNAAISYEVPSFFESGSGKALLRDWTIDSLISMRSAPPVEVFSLRNSQYGPYNLRPNLVPGVPLYLEDGAAPGGRRFNPAAFIIPTDEQQGSLSRNALRGFPMAQVDLGLNRRFKITEQFTVQVRMEVFNLFNHPNFASPVGDLDSTQFGRSTSMLSRTQTATNNTGFNPLFQTGGPRGFQFGFKFQF
jgi:hypothetical protein